MSFGKHHVSMYEGSMVGKGSPFFAVWGYVISHQKPNGKPATEMLVELNPQIIAFLLGEKEEVVVSKITEMCEPDPKSRTPDLDGRKLVKRGEYTYLVVNGLAWRKIRNDEERNEYQRIKQAEYRQRKLGRKKNTGDDGKPPSERFMSQERRAVKAALAGNIALADNIAAGEA
jgi:hypothetical protein